MMSDNDIVVKISKELEDLKVSHKGMHNMLVKMQDEKDMLKKEVDDVRRANAAVHNAVFLLEEEKINLRKAVHKLKLRNSMTQKKVLKLKEKLRGVIKDDGESSDEDLEFADYDEIGRDFILVGGINDPLSFGYKVTLLDEHEKEHKSAERYYWYLMAEYFNDQDAMTEIRTAPTYNGAENAMKNIKAFSEKKWNQIKLEMYIKAQTLKFEQARSIRNCLVSTGTSYIAVASEDKLYGTGWRKIREEAMKPLTWDGQNEGGRTLMRIRKQSLLKHSWDSKQEQAETENRVRDLRRFVWRRIDTNRRPGGPLMNRKFNGEQRQAQRN
ncbi:unnamed protein product [Caenorhabditis auriculariae]|uniref:NADAR domain-containing protein n=1 Tax=Caenorhabditis auriculariae TaxID=2777116 RepID=A0A8S1HRV5_9PELO|nr:unnamed protein product [Caenorhabditis auriculariae]